MINYLFSKTIFFFSVVGIILLSSCSKELSIVKRHYNSGYYVGINNSHNKLAAEVSIKKHAVEIVPSFKKTPREVVPSNEETIDPVLTASAENKTVEKFVAAKFVLQKNILVNPAVKSLAVNEYKELKISKPKSFFNEEKTAGVVGLVIGLIFLAVGITIGLLLTVFGWALAALGLIILIIKIIT